jgi:hypothetical protein
LALFAAWLWWIVRFLQVLLVCLNACHTKS